MNFLDQLGGIVRNSSGHVVAARSAQLYWNVGVPEVISRKYQGVVDLTS